MLFRYLVIDDSHVSRALLNGALDALRPDALIQEAINCAQARALLREGSTLPDAVFCDVVLPDGCGLEFAQELRAEYPDLRLALYTSRTEDTLREGAAAIQASFLEKPLQIEVLRDMLTLQPS